MAKFEIPASEIAELNRELSRRAGVIGKGIKEVIQAEAKPMLHDLVRLTTQSTHASVEGRSIAPKADQKRGEKAVEGDINKLFKPLKSIEAIYNPRSRRFADVVQTMLEEKDYDGIADLLESTGILDYHAKIILDADPAIHRRWRVKSTGKVSKQIKNPWLVVNERSIDGLKKGLKKGVGYAKSGWGKSLGALGMSIPAWINKGGPGDYSPKSEADKHSITMSNRVGYMQKNAARIVSRAIQLRTESLRKRTEHLLSKAVK